MASRKLVRDLFLSKQSLIPHLLLPQQVSSRTARLRLVRPNGYILRREFSVFNVFFNKVKGEDERNQELTQSVMELKEKTEELKRLKEDLEASRTEQISEQLNKRVDGVLTDIGAAAKKIKEALEKGKQESPGSTGASGNHGANKENGRKFACGGEKQQEQQQQSGSTDAESLFSRMKPGLSSISPKVSMAFKKLKEAKPIDLAKKGIDILKEELKGNPGKRKHIAYEASSEASSAKVEKSTRTDVVVLPSNQSKFSKKWEELKEKMRGHPLFKRVRGISEPVAQKSQEIAEEMRERWETSDHPVIHKIQDLSETAFGETTTAMSVKEIRRRDPSFSMPEFVADVQEVTRPVLNAYCKADVEVLKKYCSSDLIERCKAEHNAYASQGIFFDHKILHISEVEVRETKMMGDSPTIILAFQTQQVYCVRDRHGSITEGGKDTIHTMYYAWAMQQLDPEELGEGALYPIWRLREMQQFGVQALI